MRAVTNISSERRIAKNSVVLVDNIQAGIATLLVCKQAFQVPSSFLPAGVRGGSWLRVTVTLLDEDATPTPNEELPRQW